VFGLWVQHWRRTRTHGDVIVVMFADDIIVGFQHESDPRQFQSDLRDRFRKLNLEHHPEKTRSGL
jgi:hypothetical protein